MSLASLIDWGAFEQFVRNLYASDGTVVAERNVTVLGMHGERRQIDVRVTHRTALHRYVTVVECKRWKEPVSRDRIDVLASTVEAIGASKGVMFTTTGYEDGAIKYAKGKHIDLFLVKEVEDDDFGAPGRRVLMFIQFVIGVIDNFTFPDATLIHAGVGTLPTIPTFAMDRELPDASPVLHPVGNARARQPVTVREMLYKVIESGIKTMGDRAPLLDGGKDGAKLLLHTPTVAVLHDSFQFREMRLAGAVIRINRLSCMLKTFISQTRIEHDRMENEKLAVALEDLINGRRLVASQHKDSETFAMSYEKPPPASPEALVNGTIFKTYMAPGRGFDAESTLPTETGALTITIQGEAARES